MGKHTGHAESQSQVADVAVCGEEVGTGDLHHGEAAGDCAAIIPAGTAQGIRQNFVCCLGQRGKWQASDEETNCYCSRKNRHQACLDAQGLHSVESPLSTRDAERSVRSSLHSKISRPRRSGTSAVLRPPAECAKEIADRLVRIPACCCSSS